MKQTTLKLLLLISTILLMHSTLHAGLALKRVALIIGNSNYQNGATLKNPINDAFDMQETLKSKGFYVIFVKDGTKSEIIDAIDKFKSKLTRYTTGLFYYAGHAYDLHGSNYILPIDVNINSEENIKNSSISLNSILSKIKNKSKLNIVILDSMTADTISEENTFIAFASEPNGVAMDGKGRNGLFTQFILKHITTTTGNLSSIFKKITKDVYIASNGKQKPYISDRTFNEFIFNKKIAIIDKTIPVININYPSQARGVKRKKQFDSKVITIKGSIVDDSKILQSSIDNKNLALSSNGHFEASVTLKKGKNIFILRAKDKYGNESIKSIMINVERFKESSLVSKLDWYTNQYALIVGINNYKMSSIPTLQNAVNDAKKLSQIFENQGFNVISLYNENATKQKILRAIKKIKKQASPKDNFIFYFAGHGQGLTLSNKEKVGYLLPYDSNVDLLSEDVFDYDETAISLNQIKRYAKAMNTKHVALLLDSCFSGLAMKRSVPKAIKYNVDYYNDILSRRSINILTAGDDQPVSDGSGHSPFTIAIIEGIEKKGLDIADRDGLATFTELSSYVKAKVEKATNREQRPQFDNLSHEDGDFLFLLK